MRCCALINKILKESEFNLDVETVLSTVFNFSVNVVMGCKLISVSKYIHHLFS